MNVLLSQHKASQEEQQQKHQGSQGIGHYQVSSKGTNRTEKSDCIIVDEEGEKPEHEYPAWMLDNQHFLSLASNM